MSNTRKGENLMKRLPPKPICELGVEVTPLRAEDARLKPEKEILAYQRRPPGSAGEAAEV